MAERPEDLNLPNAVVTRIIKDAIPEGVIVSKEARLAISKAASVFVLYATSCSNNFALRNKRKTIGAQDVLNAMEDMEFEQFIEPLQQCQEAFRQEKLDKKKERVVRPLPSAQSDPGGGDGGDGDDDDADEVEELSDVERGEATGPSSETKAGDGSTEDFVITKNKPDDDGSDSSVEMIEDEAD